MKPQYIEEDGEKYSPEYDKWNDQKQFLNFEKTKLEYPPYKEGDIWWIQVGLNIGNEVYGKNKDFRRPVLIIKKMGRTFFGIPLTSQNKDGIPGFFRATYRKEKSSWAMLGQVRVFSAYRLLHKNPEVGKVPGKVLKAVKEEIRKFYDL